MSRSAEARSLEDEAVAWHDVECASYDVDLPLWRELAAELGGPVLDLGCGTGRVALDLAARGHEVIAVDSDRDLVRALAGRARRRGLAVSAHVADLRTLALGGPPVPLAVAPMQVMQLLGGRAGRERALERVRAHLAPGGVLAVALADPFEGVPPEEARPPLPDMLEEGGWVLSSTPVAVREQAGGTAIDRLRHAVAPSGELTESMSTVVLDRLEAEELEDAALLAGLIPRPSRRVPETEGYVGSTVVVLEAP